MVFFRSAILFLAVATGILWRAECLAQTETTGSETQKTGKALLVQQASDMRPLIHTEAGRSFLDSAQFVPEVTERTVWGHSEDRRRFVPEPELKKLDREEGAKFSPRQLDENFYYFTRYGSPLAFSRPIEIVAAQNALNFEETRLVDFGFGTIGHLRMLACLGADVTGIEVDQMLRALYSDSSDVGVIPNSNTAGKDGRLELLFGKFPSQLGESVRGDADLFVSKNTLKRGYIHPDQPVDPAKLVHLDCSDEEFVVAVHRILKPGGYFLIYNLHPPHAAEGQPYIPWADGRCPFDRRLLESSGFEVIDFDVDDSAAARAMGRSLGWESQMDLQTDLFATYTLLRKHK